MSLIRNVVAFWPNFIREAWLLFKFRRAVKSIQNELEGQGLRVDWLGRIYTVVNLPDEYRTQPEMMQQSIVFKELKPTNDILMKYGLSEHAYPLIEKINDNTAIAFLVVLYPETDYFNFWRTLWNSLLLLSIIKLVSLGITYGPSIINMIQELF